MSHSDYIRFRIDASDKAEAKKLFSKMGFSLSQALNVFIRQSIIDNGLPFKPHADKIPNQATIAAIEELESGAGKRFTDTQEFYADLDI